MTGRRLTTAEAAARLGVKPETLYAYVSRGLLEREKGAAGSTFDAAEIERLAGSGRDANRRDRGRGERAGAPAFVTELTLIEEGRLWYRGLDAIELSRSRSLEEVASWLWQGEWPADRSGWDGPDAVAQAARAACATLPPSCPPAARWRVAVAAAATADPLRHDRQPAAVVATARGLLATLVDVLPPAGRPLAGPESPVAGRPSLADRLWPCLSPWPATAAQRAALDAALVLLADHEVAVSTLAARAAAAYGADPYAVVLVGMASSSGPRHAASSLEVRPVVEAAAAYGAAAALGEVLSRGGPVHGFGQVLYPDGDPRGRELLARLHEPFADRMVAVDALIDLAASRAMPPPNVDFALAALAHGGGMVPGASEAVFVLGRTVGWIAHALEEYAAPTSFRARAAYVGPRPRTGPARR